MPSQRIALSLFLVGFTMLVSLSTAWAARPEVIGPIHDEGEAPLGDCGTFQIIDRYTLSFTLRFMYDRNGTLVRIEEQVRGTDTFINSVTGKSIPTKFANAVHIDPATGLGANTGVIFRVTVPGSGAVLLDVGRIVTNRAGDIITFRAGPHQFFDGDLAGLCKALA